MLALSIILFEIDVAFQTESNNVSALYESL